MSQPVRIRFTFRRNAPVHQCPNPTTQVVVIRKGDRALVRNACGTNLRQTQKKSATTVSHRFFRCRACFRNKTARPLPCRHDRTEDNTRTQRLASRQFIGKGVGPRQLFSARCSVLVITLPNQPMQLPFRCNPVVQTLSRLSNAGRGDKERGPGFGSECVRYKP